MDTLLPILAIAGAVTLGAMSPGPSFLLVARTSIAVSRIDGLATALGMGMGAMLFSIIALVGFQAVLSAIPALYTAIRIAGGAYLLVLAWRIWRGAGAPIAIQPSDDGSEGKPQRRIWIRSCLIGLGTQVSNPKTAIVYGSIFASLLPRSLPGFLFIVLPVLVFIIETTWYTLVAVVLSTPANRTRYLRSKAIIDRITGGILALLGLRLVLGTRRAGS